MKEEECLKKFIIIFALFLLIFSCKEKEKVMEIRSYPINDLNEIITKDGVEIDHSNSFDGKGSLKVQTVEPVTIKLFEVGKVEAEDSNLVYQAKLKCENLEGQAFLEMWCSFLGKGEYFSRGMQAPVSGNVGWMTSDTLFILKKGENPDNVKLNLVINGKGTVWIDDVHLFKVKNMP